MRKAYDIFAKYYDDLTVNVDYDSIAVYINGLVGKYGCKGKGILLDIACGTGSMSEKMARLGYDVIGVDSSGEMLGYALDKKFESGQAIQYLCQDMRELDMFGTIDVTICILDSINHLESFEDVKKTFSKVSLFAEPGGLFIFDLNTEYKHRNILADNVFVYETDSVYCVWSNNYHPDDSTVDISLDFFEQYENVYRRYSENFAEKVYASEQVDTELIDLGFEVLAHYDGYSFAPVNDKTERITYVARKVK